MVNIWKVSTLALAGALALVVSRGAIRESAACGPDDDDFENTAAAESQIRLTSALSLLNRAEQQVRAATAARPLPRAKALEGIALAKMQVKKGLEPASRPRPVRAKVVELE